VEKKRGVAISAVDCIEVCLAEVVTWNTHIYVGKIVRQTWVFLFMCRKMAGGVMKLKCHSQANGLRATDVRDIKGIAKQTFSNSGEGSVSIT